jgi:hypothetical protein
MRPCSPEQAETRNDPPTSLTHREMRIFSLVLATAAMLMVACSATPTAPGPASGASKPAVADIAVHYASYQKMTSREVFVDPELASLCIGTSLHHVEAARKTKGPHAHTAILVYMNTLAAQAFGRGESYPVGAVIVKQKSKLSYDGQQPGATSPAGAQGVGGMVKRARGYDPQHGDWEYFYFEDPAAIETGRIASCVACHTSARRSDYVFGSWAEPAHP